MRQVCGGGRGDTGGGWGQGGSLSSLALRVYLGQAVEHTIFNYIFKINF